MRDPIDVIVIGGGVAGLAAAWALLRDGGPGIRVTVLESSADVGGKLALTDVGGFVVDSGAESMLARRPEGVALAREVGLDDDIVHPAVEGASVWSRSALRPLPRGLLMGIPTDLRSLAASQIMSLRGLGRIPIDQVRRRTPVDGDISMGDLVAARLGREVVDRLVEPLLGGVYAGHADEISLDAALPQLAVAMRLERSLLGSAEQLALASVAAGPVFASIRGGLGRLPLAIAGRLRERGCEVRVGATVRAVTATPQGWEVVVGDTRAPEVLTADALVVAVPAAPAARLLREVVPAAAADLAAVESASVAIVTVVLPRDAVTTVGTGFLVPPVEGRLIKAATYSSAKWGWLSEVDGGDDHVVLRMSVGRHREEADLQHSDDELAVLALEDLERIAGIRAHPAAVRVTRWGGALPQYTVGHLDRIARVQAAVDAHPGLAVCGAAYDGVGVPACIASAERAAARVLRSRREQPQWGHG